MSKKQMIFAIAGGLLSFVGAFTAAWLVGRRRACARNRNGSATDSRSNTTAMKAEPAAADSQTGDEQETTKGLTEKQLKNLVYEVREKIHDYEGKMKELELREARLQMTQETLKKDIEELNRLRVELAALVANLKEQRSRLLETRAEITQSEKTNLTSIAATYDKMDPASRARF